MTSFTSFLERFGKINLGLIFTKFFCTFTSALTGLQERMHAFSISKNSAGSDNIVKRMVTFIDGNDVPRVE